MKNLSWTQLPILLVLLCPLVGRVHAQPGPGGNANLLTSWSFFDTNTWHSDWDFAPISYTNLSSSLLGDGTHQPTFLAKGRNPIEQPIPEHSTADPCSDYR